MSDTKLPFTMTIGWAGDGETKKLAESVAAKIAAIGVPTDVKELPRVCEKPGAVRIDLSDDDMAATASMEGGREVADDARKEGEAMTGLYTLDANGDAVSVPEGTMPPRLTIEQRTVAKTKVGDAEVSTVFLWIDHSWNGGPPVLWETMIFGGLHSDYQERYTSRAAAIAGHMRAVDLCLSGQSVAVEKPRGRGR
jgi:hypothetical protein